MGGTGSNIVILLMLKRRQALLHADLSLIKLKHGNNNNMKNHEE